MKAKYYIDGDGGNNLYDTLSAIRWHIELCSNSDKRDYNGMFVFRLNDERFFRVIKVLKKGKIILSKS